MRLYRDRESVELHRCGLVVWDGGVRTKFADFARACAGFETALAARLATGYVLGPDELIEIEARRVLADAQIERGDPIGHIFVLQDAIARRPKDVALAAELAAVIAAAHPTILGPLAPHVDVQWRFGLATDVALRTPTRYGELCASPIGKQVQRLRVSGFPGLRDVEPAQPVMRFVRDLREWGTPPNLLRLEIRAPADRIQSLPDISDIVSAAVELDELWLDIRCARLETLASPLLRSIVASEMDPAPLLVPGAVPALRELAVVKAVNVDDFVRALAVSGVLPGLTHLRLPTSGVTLALLNVFVAQAAKFRHLEVLDLSFNDLPRGAVRDARDALPGLQIEAMSLGAGRG